LTGIKKIKGVKRFILVDSLGIVLHARVEPANISEKHGAKNLLSGLKPIYPNINNIYADGGYRGDELKDYLYEYGFNLVVVKRNSTAFKILPKRWIVERTFAWLNRFRRLSKNFEARVQTSELFINLATLRILLRRVAS
jgi:putative transposase